MRWYYDYISPYAYLQSTKLSQFSQLQSVECVPILFAGLLNHWGNVGPAEIEPKRQWTFRNCLWLAQRDGIPLTPPRHHPFDPLPLLRLSIIHNSSIELVQRLFRYVWVEGNLPQDEAAFSALLDEVHTKPEELTCNTVKQKLRENGLKAIERGIFGVPTVEYRDDIIWGYESNDMVLAALSGAKHYIAREFTSADTLAQGPARKPAGSKP